MSEIRNPNSLIIVTQALLKSHPEWVETLAPYYDLRAERSLDPGFKAQVEFAGRVTDPIKIKPIPNIGDVVTDGRQRARAGTALGYASVPVQIEDVGVKDSITLELLGNLARSENTIRENAVAFKKALQNGMSKADVATIANVSEVTVLNTIYLGELPPFVHKLIDNGQLSPTAALGLYKNFGSKAAKGSGLSKVFDEESQKQMKEFIATLDTDARLSGNKRKITVKQARSSAPNHVENLTNKEWDAIVAEASTPEWAANLINAVRGKCSWQTARFNAKGFLDFLHKPTIEKKVKEPKVKQPKKEKEAKEAPPEQPASTEVNTTAIPDALDFLQ